MVSTFGHYVLMAEQGTHGGRHRVRLDRYGRLASVLLGFVAGGMAVNLLADGYRYRGLTAAVAVGAVLATASWLRKLPPRAPLSRHATRLLLIAALLALLLAAAGPVSWGPWAMAAAAALTGIAVLVPTDFQTAASLLAGVTMTVAGVAFVLVGHEVSPVNATPSSVAVVVAGAGCTVVGVALLAFGDVPVTTTCTVVGTAIAVWGATVLTTDYIQPGIVATGAGMAIAALGASPSTKGGALTGIVATGVGLAIAALGGWTLVGFLVGGAILAVIGMAIAVSGFAVLTGGTIPSGVAVTGMGVTVAVLSYGQWSAGGETYATAVTGVSAIAVILGVVTLTRGGAGARMRAWWDRMTNDPEELPNITG